MAIGVRQPYLKGPYSAAWPVPCKCRWLGLSSGRQFVRICESVEWSQWVVIHDFHLFLVVSHVFLGDFHGFLQFVMVSIAYLESTNGLTGVGSGDTYESKRTCNFWLESTNGIIYLVCAVLLLYVLNLSTSEIPTPSKKETFAKSLYLHSISCLVLQMCLSSLWQIFVSPAVDIDSDPLWKPANVFVPPRVGFAVRDEPGNGSLTSLSFGKSLASTLDKYLISTW